MIKITTVLFLIMTFSYAADDELSLSDSEEDLGISFPLYLLNVQREQELENFDKQFSSEALRDDDLITIWETIRELDPFFCKRWLDGVARTIIGKRNIIALSHIKSSLEDKNYCILGYKKESIIESLSIVGSKARIQEILPQTLETKLLEAEAKKIKIGKNE